MQKLADEVLCLLVVIDVAYHIADAVKNDEIGLADRNRREDTQEPVLPVDRPEVKDMVQFFTRRFSDHRSDTVAEDLTGAVCTLLRIDPNGT